MPITFDFTGRTVLVTGGAHGIGLDLGRFFRDSGARVAVADMDGDTLNREWQDSGDSVLPLVLDVADDRAVSSAVAQIVEWTGQIDVAVNNAGITRDAMVWKLEPAQWNEVINVHLSGTYHVTRAVLPHMRQANYGRIINITSSTGLRGNAGQSNYGAAKAGIVGFTKSVAREVARRGITVNAVSPSVATRMIAAIPPETLKMMLAAVPTGRFATPSETNAAIGFLASEEAGSTTGTVLRVEGGSSI